MKFKGEDKINKFWIVTLIVTSLVIIIWGTLLVNKVFTSNHLEGKWKSEELNLALDIENNGKCVIILKSEEEKEVEIQMEYFTNQEMKTIVIRVDTGMIGEQEEVGLSKEEVLTILEPLLRTFSYSVENGSKRLVLTEPDYGEKIEFIKE